MKLRPVVEDTYRVIALRHGCCWHDKGANENHQNTTPSVRGTAGTSGNLVGEAYLGRGVLAGLFTDRTE